MQPIAYATLIFDSLFREFFTQPFDKGTDIFRGGKFSLPDILFDAFKGDIFSQIFCKKIEKEYLFFSEFNLFPLSI